MIELSEKVTHRYTELALQIGLEAAAKVIDQELKLARQSIETYWQSGEEDA